MNILSKYIREISHCSKFHELTARELFSTVEMKVRVLIAAPIPKRLLLRGIVTGGLTDDPGLIEGLSVFL